VTSSGRLHQRSPLGAGDEFQKAPPTIFIGRPVMSSGRLCRRSSLYARWRVLDSSAGDLYWAPGDEIQKAPSTISIRHPMHVDWCTGWDLVPFTHIIGRAASCGSVVKLRWLLPSSYMSFFDFHVEDNARECHGGWVLRSSNGRLSLRGDEDFAWSFLTCSSDIDKRGRQHNRST
jgi:hypothetical protein